VGETGADEITYTFNVLRQHCGQLPVVLGAAPARVLASLSFADILDEEREVGYQRPFDLRHARDFHAYIHRPAATTIPLTFNLRRETGWNLTPARDGEMAVLSIAAPAQGHDRVLARVDCQHRLGAMGESDTPLTFQCYLGLTPAEEMAVFNVINGKAKGLSSSLTDYHDTKLIPDLDSVRVELYVAKTLNNDEESVWHKKVGLGGRRTTQGAFRHVSLRGLQTATKLFLQRATGAFGEGTTPQEKYLAVRSFWRAVSLTWPEAWAKPRANLLSKGVGVNALSLLAADIAVGARRRGQQLTVATFSEYLVPLRSLDWGNDGAFKGYGGKQGAREAHKFLLSGDLRKSLAIVRAV